MIVITLLFISNSTSEPALAQTKKLTTEYEKLRIEGLRNFYAGKFDAALKSFDSANAEAHKSYPDSEQEAMSLFDMARAQDCAGQKEKADSNFQIAIEMSKKVSGEKTAPTLYMMLGYSDFLEHSGKKAEAERFRKAGDYAALNGTDDRPIGAAEVDAKGVVVLNLRAEGPGIIGHSRLTYEPNGKDYDMVIQHLGPLKPGEHQIVLPWKN